MRWAPPDEIIEEILREGAKTPKELLHECKKRGLKGKKYYRHLEKLIKIGEINEARYEWIGEKEADPNEVSECIERLKQTDNKDLLIMRSEDLRRLCNGKRTAHLPNVLTFLESALEDPKFKDPKIIRNVIEAIYRVLAYERKRRNPSKKIIERISKNMKQMKQIVKEQHHPNVLGGIFYFLGETGEEEAVHMIFNLAPDLSEREFEDMKSAMGRSLFSPECTLYEKYRKLINNELDKMITSPDSSISQKGKALAQEKQNRRAYA